MKLRCPNPTCNSQRFYFSNYPLDIVVNPALKISDVKLDMRWVEERIGVGKQPDSADVEYLNEGLQADNKMYNEHFNDLANLISGASVELRPGTELRCAECWTAAEMLHAS